MFRIVAFEEIKNRYPQHVKEVIAKIRKSRGKHKNDAPETFKWGFTFSVRIEGGIMGTDFMQMIAGAKPFPKEKEFKSEDSYVADFARRAMVFVGATKNTKTIWASQEKIELPREIEEDVRKQRQEELAEKARITALTPEERDRETNEALRQLRRSPGFVEMRIPTRDMGR